MTPSSAVPHRPSGMVSDNQYFVEAITAERTGPESTVEFLVKWDGYPPEESTWEPRQNIHPDIIDEWLKDKLTLTQIDSIEDNHLAPPVHTNGKAPAPRPRRAIERYRWEDGKIRRVYTSTEADASKQNKNGARKPIERYRWENGDIGLVGSSISARQADQTVEKETKLANTPDSDDQQPTIDETVNIGNAVELPSTINTAEVLAPPSPTDYDSIPNVPTLFAAPGIEIEFDITQPPAGVDAAEWQEMLDAILSINDEVGKMVE